MTTEVPQRVGPFPAKIAVLVMVGAGAGDTVVVLEIRIREVSLRGQVLPLAGNTFSNP